MDEAKQQAVDNLVANWKVEFERSKNWFISAINSMAEDRLAWSPSETARTPLAMVAHVALSIGHLHGNLRGETFSVPTMADADVYHLDQENAIGSISEALGLLEANTREYFAWLDGLTFEDLRKVVAMPFGMPSLEISAALPFMAKHIDWHHAQLQYLQTIYGDRTWI